MIDRVTVQPDGDGYVIELVGDIVKMITLPGGRVPDPFASSVKVVAGARNGRCSQAVPVAADA